MRNFSCYITSWVKLELEDHLKYSSRKIPIVFKNGLNTFNTFQINGIELSEKYTIPKGGANGEYQIVLSKKILKKDSVNDLLGVETRMIKICEDLNNFHTYVTGSPINMKVKSGFGNKRKIKIYPYTPDGWFDNKNDLLNETNANTNLSFAKANLSYHELPTVTLSESPLPDLISFLERQKYVNPLVNELIYFHSQAFRHELDIKYLILGKALEIARQFLPNKHDLKNSFKLLPNNLQEKLGKNNLTWIYNMSQNRYETRHLIDLKSSEKMHPKMTSEECWNFATASHLLLTYIVRNEFELDELIWDFN